MKNILSFLVTTILLSQINLNAQWSLVNTPPNFAYAVLQDVRFSDQSTGFIVGNNGIIFRTTDGGNIWDYLPSGTNNDLHSIYFINSDTGFVCGSSGTVLKTMNAGNSWTNTNLYYNFSSIYFSNQNTGFLIGSYVSLGNEFPIFFKTTNEGNEWLPMNVSGISIPTAVFFVDSNVGYILGLDNQVTKTTNGGNSWITLPPPGVYSASDIFFSSVDTGYIFAGGELVGYNYGTIKKTTDGGMTWITKLILSSYINSSLMKGNFINNDIGYVVGCNIDFILMTNDGGNNWSMEALGTAECLNSIFFTNENKGYAVGYPGKIFQTFNGVFLPVELTSFTVLYSNPNINLNWSTATELNNHGFEIEKSIDKTIWATIGFKEGKGTTSEPQDYTYSDNILEISSSKLFYRLKQIDFNGSFEYSHVVEVEIAPTKFSLEQNYPNPFNPSTKISWQAPVSGWQTLKVYDVLGNEVATLVNEEKPAGNYEVEFDASNLSSGVYFYILKAGDFIQSKKMILMK